MVSAAVVVLAIAIRIALPFALEWAIPWAAEAQLGARASVGNIDIGLIVGEISINDLVFGLPSEDESQMEPLLKLRRLHIEFEWTELLAKRLHIRSLLLDTLLLDLTELRDGKLKLPALPESAALIEPESEPGATRPVPSDGKAVPTPVTEEETALPSTIDRDSVGHDAVDHDAVDHDAVDQDEVDQDAVDPGWEYVVDRFELNRSGATLTSESTGSEVVRFSAARLAFDAMKFGPDGLELGGIEFEEPEAYVQQDWLMGLGATEQQPTATESSAPTPAIHLKHLKIDHAAFTVNTDKGPVRVVIQLEITNAGTARGRVFPIDLGLEIGGGQVELAGKLGLNPISFEGGFSWQNLERPPFLRLIAPAVLPWLRSATAEGNFDVAFRSVPGSQPAGLTATGNSSISDLILADPESGEHSLAWDRLEIEVRHAFFPLETSAKSPIRLDVTSLTFSSPKIVYTNPPDALNRLLSALGGGGQEPSTEPLPSMEASSPVPSSKAPSSKAPSSKVPSPRDDGEPDADSIAPNITVETLTIENGHMNYVDKTVSPTHETSIDDLRVRISDITTDPSAGAGAIAIDGLIQQTGTFKLRGSLPGGNGKLQFELERIDLVSYDSFAREAGWRVTSGTTSLKSLIEAHSGAYETQSEIVLHDLEVTPDEGGGFSAAFGVSLDLALALLRDPYGDISLSIPITIGKDDIGVEMGSLILSALRSAVAGALTSPIKFIGALFPKGGGSASFDVIGFDAGSNALNVEGDERLSPLAELLTKRPGLQLSLQGQWSAEDRPMLALAILHEKALSGESFPEIEDSFFAGRRVVEALRKRAVGDEGFLEPEDEQRLQRYVETQPVPTARFRRLAESRAEVARAHLLDSGVAAESVSIEPAESSDRAGVSLALHSTLHSRISGADDPSQDRQQGEQ